MKHARPSPPVERPPSRTPGHRLTHPRWAFIGLIVCVAVAVPVLALAWSALRAPDALQRTETTGSVDYGIGLDYTFSGDPSTVYPSGTVDATPKAGDAVIANGPLYSRLLDRLDVTLAFRATEDGAERLTSTYAVEVNVSTPGGWATTVETIEGERFRNEATETVSVNLRDVARRVQSVGELTGVGGDSYTIEVQPELTVSATTDSSPVDDAIRTPLSFTVEGNLITAEAIESSESTPLTRNVTERAVYSVGPLEMRTQPARALLSGLSLVLVAGIVWFASVLFGGLGLVEPDRIAARYRSQIVDVAEATAPPGPVVMVGGIDELVRIAKVEQSVILHEDLGEGAHRYRVFLGTVTYEYETAPEHPGAAGTADVTTGSDEVSG